MKTRMYLIIIGLIGVLLASCKPNTGEITPDFPEEGTSTVIGSPEGDAVSKVIGPEGGTIASADGMAVLVLPAGAVTTSTTISVQAISNHTPNGINQAYRFLPEGIQFAKPGTLTFSYQKEDVSVNDAENLRVAYQKDDGVWYSVGGVSTDTAARKISVPMSHFSDWSPFEIAQMEATEIESEEKKDIVYFGEQVRMRVLELYPIGANEDNKFLVIRDKKGEQWNVIGKNTGTITMDKFTAIYTAPMGMPGQNPVTVTATVTYTNGKKLILLKPIVVGTGYMKLNFQGKHYLLMANLDDNQLTYFDIAGATAGKDNVALTFSVNAYGPGTCTFGDPSRIENVNTCEVELKVGTKQFRSAPGYCDEVLSTTKGTLKLTRYERGKFTKGTFEGEVFPFEQEMGCGTLRGPNISGEFVAGPLP